MYGSKIKAAAWGSSRSSILFKLVTHVDGHWEYQVHCVSDKKRVRCNFSASNSNKPCNQDNSGLIDHK